MDDACLGNKNGEDFKTVLGDVALHFGIFVGCSFGTASKAALAC